MAKRSPRLKTGRIERLKNRPVKNHTVDQGAPGAATAACSPLQKSAPARRANKKEKINGIHTIDASDQDGRDS